MGKNYFCNLCTEGCVRKRDLKRHILRKHGKNETEWSVFVKKTKDEAPAHAHQERPPPAHAHQERPPPAHAHQERPPPAHAHQERPPPAHAGTSVFKLIHPFTMIIAAPTGFGKSHFVAKLLKHRETMIEPPPERIIYLYKRWQPLFEEMKESIPNIEFIQGLPYNLQDDSFLDPKVRNLICIDDLMAQGSKDQRVQDLFTEGSHHRNLSVICLLQNFYFPGTQTMRRNSHYMVLFNMPADKTQIRSMSQQMFPQNPQHMLNAYEHAVSKPYGYLLLNLKPNTAEKDKLKTDIFNEENQKIASEPSNDDSKDMEEQHLQKEDTFPEFPAEVFMPVMAWACAPFQGKDHSDYPAGLMPFLKHMADNLPDKRHINNDHTLAHLCIFEYTPKIYMVDATFACCLCKEENVVVVIHLVQCPRCLAEDFNIRSANDKGKPYECMLCDHTFRPESSRKCLGYCQVCDRVTVYTPETDVTTVVQGHPVSDPRI